MKLFKTSIALAIIFAIYAQNTIPGCCCSKKSCGTKTKQTKQIKNTTTTTQEKKSKEQETQVETKEKSDNSKVTAEISIGELIDKITILQIKAENITDPAKIKNIHTELTTLTATLNTLVPKSPELDELTAQLLDINKQLWDIEDNIRDKERNKCFDKEFIEIARYVYYTNDDRCRVKRSINDLTGSRLVEEKSYAAY